MLAWWCGIVRQPELRASVQGSIDMCNLYFHEQAEVHLIVMFFILIGLLIASLANLDSCPSATADVVLQMLLAQTCPM